MKKMLLTVLALSLSSSFSATTFAGHAGCYLNGAVCTCDLGKRRCTKFFKANCGNKGLWDSNAGINGFGACTPG